MIIYRYLVNFVRIMQIVWNVDDCFVACAQDSKDAVLQTMPSSHIAAAAAPMTVHNKPAATSLPSPSVSQQIPATNPAIEPPVGFASGQMYPTGFPPQLWSGVTPTSE